MTMTHDLPFNPAPKLLVFILDRAECKRLEEVLREKQVYFHYMFNAMGTASSEMLKLFGLSGTSKIVCICMEPAVKAKPLLTSLVDRLELTNPGKGIAFTMPISGLSASISNAFNNEFQQNKERWADWMDKEAEKMGEEARYELIVSVINQGYSEILMDAARTAGARGGTIVHSRRMGIEDDVKFFGITIQAEKEIGAILAHRHQKREWMQAISKVCGMRTEARGIVVSLPVESCAGIDGIETWGKDNA